MQFDAQQLASQDALNHLAKIGAGLLPGHLGIEIEQATSDEMIGSIAIQMHHAAPNGFLHAGTVVTLADTLSGYGTVLNLPVGAAGFTTIELKSNFFSTAKSGIIRSTARPVHRGKTTQVWDAEVIHADTGKRMALFRCTQAILWPK